MSKAKELLERIEESATKDQNIRVLKKLLGGEWESGGKLGSFSMDTEKLKWNKLSFNLEDVKASSEDSKKGLDDVGQVVRLSDGSTNAKFKRVK